MRTAIVKMDGCQYQVEVCTRITRLHPQGGFFDSQPGPAKIAKLRAH